MEPASGLGGVLKAMLALEHDMLPPSLHSEDLTPHIDFEALNLEVAREATPLPRLAGRPRLAGVNSFGFGGTNSHVVLADAPAGSHRGRDAAGLSHSLRAQPRRPRRAGRRLRRALRPAPTRTRRSRWHGCRRPSPRAPAASRRRAARRREPADIAAILDRICDEEQDVVGAARGTAIEREAPVAFVFSGNGSQFAGMGLAAYRLNPCSAPSSTSISDGFRRPRRLVDRRHAAGRGPGLQTLELTQIAQPLLYAIQAASLPCVARAGPRARHRVRPQRRRGRGCRGRRHPRSRPAR